VLRPARIGLYGGQVVPEVGVGVRDRVGEVDCVHIVLAGVLERRSVEGLAVVGDVLSDSILEVTDIITAFVPPDVMLVSLLLAVDRDLHTVIEKAIRLRVVEQVETNFGLLSGVLHLEEEPLGVSLSVDIVGHQKVIFDFGNFLRKVKVAAFESGFKYECLVVVVLQLVHLRV